MTRAGAALVGLVSLPFRHPYHAEQGAEGGYRVPRSDITVTDILRVIESGKTTPDMDHSSLAKKVILPALAPADRSFAAALAQIKVADLVAEAMRQRVN